LPPTLEAESSHNGNLALTARQEQTRTGALRASVNGFIRKIENQILLVGAERDARYQNVYGARSLGVESNVGWTSREDYLSVDGNLTYVDLRNTSSRGTFGRYQGDRIPNRPYLFANGATRGMLPSLLHTGDELSLTWYVRYVHGFDRFWSRYGAAKSKLTIPAQHSHTLSLS
jgi:vitamin B12 transporter